MIGHPDDLRFLAGGQAIDFGDGTVGELLDVVLRAALLVLGVVELALERGLAVLLGRAIGGGPGEGAR